MKLKIQKKWCGSEGCVWEKVAREGGLRRNASKLEMKLGLDGCAKEDRRGGGIEGRLYLER